MDDEGAAVDELCPIAHTVLEQELKMKTKILNKLLEKLIKNVCYAKNPFELIQTLMKGVPF
jgi:hypothetical protein